MRPVLLIAIVLGFLAKFSFGFDIRYWAWQRDERLTNAELAELAAQKVDTIYWHAGELQNTGEAWRWKTRFALPAPAESRLNYVPVVRLVSRQAQPFSSASTISLMVSLAPLATKHDELQLDYDAPDRLLGDYGEALKQIRRLVRRLTITALPHWSRPDCLGALESNVDELLPMLYDFEAEPVLKNHAPLPLIAPEKMARMLNDWRGCGKPWRAGLPVFARLTLYDAAGKFRGQIRNWNWDELCFGRSLALVSPAQFGTSVLRAKTSTSVSNTRLRENEELAARVVDRAALRDAIAAASKAGAQGVVFFRLPDGSASSGWSLHQLGHLEAKPELIVRKSNAAESLELRNRGDGDLEPRFTANETSGSGFALELETVASIFREAQPGDFAAVAASSMSGDRIKPAAVPFATRLVFRFSRIRAQEILRTGLIQLAPGADFRQVRYRVIGVEENPPWKSLE